MRSIRRARAAHAPLLPLVFAAAALGADASHAQAPGAVDYTPELPPNATYPLFVNTSTAVSGPNTSFADVGSGRGQSYVDIVGPDPAAPFDPKRVGPPDGILDLVQVNSNTPELPVGSGPAAWDYPSIGTVQVPSRVLRGTSSGTFIDVTGSMSPLNPLGYGLDYPGASPWGVTAADYDADGDVDLFYPCGGFNIDSENSLQRNEGDGTFVPVSVPAGLGGRQSSYASSWLDYDRDGDLDLYVANSSDTWAASYLGTPDPDPTDRLFRNAGDGTFTEVGSAAGVNLKSNGFSVASGDLDRDGWPDLVVSCYRQLNKCFYNNQDGTFAFMAPATNPAFQISLDDMDPDPAFPGAEDFAFIPPGFGSVLPVLGDFSMPVEIQDFNGDGWMDIAFACWSRQLPDALVESAEDALFSPFDPSRLYINLGDQDGQDGLGDGLFREVGAEVGFSHVGGSMGIIAGDYNADGFVDVYFGGGGPQLDAHLEEDYLYINDGPSWPANLLEDPEQDLPRTFYEVGALAGTYPNKFMAHGLTPARGPSGRVDVLVGNGGPAQFDEGQANVYWRNTGYADGSTPEFLQVNLLAQQSTPGAFGARVEVVRTDAGAPGQWLAQERRAGVAFSSSSHEPLSFGLDAAGVLFANVTWPSGVRGGQLLWPATALREVTLSETTLSVGLDVSFPEAGGLRLEGFVAETGSTATLGNLIFASLNATAPGAYAPGIVSLIAPLATIAPGSPLSLDVSLPPLPDGLYTLLFFNALGTQVLGTNAVWIDAASAQLSAAPEDSLTAAASTSPSAWRLPAGGWDGADRAGPERPSEPRTRLHVARSLRVGAERVSIAPARLPLEWQALEGLASDASVVPGTQLRFAGGTFHYRADPGPPAALAVDAGALTLTLGGAATCCDAGAEAEPAGWLVRIEGLGANFVADSVCYTASGERVSP